MCRVCACEPEFVNVRYGVCVCVFVCVEGQWKLLDLSLGSQSFIARLLIHSDLQKGRSYVPLSPRVQRQHINQKRIKTHANTVHTQHTQYTRNTLTRDTHTTCTHTHTHTQHSHTSTACARTSLNTQLPTLLQKTHSSAQHQTTMHTPADTQ